jgi:hypothetical protein
MVEYLPKSHGDSIVIFSGCFVFAASCPKTARLNPNGFGTKQLEGIDIGLGQIGFGILGLRRPSKQLKVARLNPNGSGMKQPEDINAGLGQSGCGILGLDSPISVLYTTGIGGDGFARQSSFFPTLSSHSSTPYCYYGEVNPLTRWTRLTAPRTPIASLKPAAFEGLKSLKKPSFAYCEMGLAQ